MQKQNFSYIIILMALSLLGIIAVQLFWVNKAITIKEEQFNQQVNEALSRASYRIERNQNASIMANFMSTIPQVQMRQYFSQGGMKQPNGISIEFTDYWQNESKHKTLGSADKNVRKHIKSENGNEIVRYSYDTIINDGFSQQRIQSFSEYSVPKAPSTVTQNGEKTQTISSPNPNQKQQQFDDVMEQMIFEFSIRNFSIEDRLSNTIITPVIKHELDNFNIPLKFEYAVINKDGNYYNKLKTKGFVKSKAKKAYQTTLFPSDISMQSDKLELYFPERRNYLINNLLWPFMGSVIFTLIILFTFYYTLKIIYNQKKVSEIKSDFINNMTHEFKTPIATISLAADTISNPSVLNSPDKVSWFIGIIKDENKRMNRQVESVLKMALIDKKDFNLNVKDTNVHPLIEKAVKNIRLQVEQNNGTIELETGAENDLLHIDETHFANLVYNLLDNANKYSLDSPPEIRVTTYNSNGNFYLAIADKGIGMDKDTQEKIFEKFYRVPTGNVHTVKGFGLGLSYVKAIIMQFKGDISVNSTKGAGSTFTINIPLKI